MGLDITIRTDIDELIEEELYEIENHFEKYSLSRTFCNFMCRKDNVRGKAELDRIGEITNIDVRPLYEMEDYPSDENLEFLLFGISNPIEEKEIIAQLKKDQDDFGQNIDKVHSTLVKLISKLTEKTNLATLLKPKENNLLNHDYYFSDFSQNKGKGYINNNFGQDLRNFKDYIDFVKVRGAKIVWFEYG